MSKPSEKPVRKASPGAKKSNLLTNLVLVLPLLVFYEIGVLASAHMNGADLITGWLVRMVGVRGLVGVQLGLIAAVIGLASHLRRTEQFHVRQILPVVLESTLYALAMGTLIVFVMVDILKIDPRLAGTGPLATTTLFQKLVMSVGAGVHEELVFRFGIMGATLFLLRKTGMVTNRVGSLLIALGLSAFLFSAAHHIGPLGDQLKLGVFVFRLLGGIFFGLLFHFRNFAVAVYTHAIYDIYVLVLS